MSTDSSRCYELLGVKPGASVAELKAAYRDMAKVWHPDRFGHDERLQKKAQDKLKEINEAYELLVSGKAPRTTRATSNERQTTSRSREFDPSYTSSTPKPKRSAISWKWIVVPLVIFGLVFFITSRSLLRSNAVVSESTRQETATNHATAAHATSAKEVSGPTTRRDTAEADNRTQPKSSESPASNGTALPVQQMKTVTLLIDPGTGLLARADCPTKSRMTYPAGNEPQGACNASHARSNTDGNESRVKAVAKRVVTPSKWLGSSNNKEKSESNQ